MKLIEITGQKFNRFTVIRYLGEGYWECRCDCGNISKQKGAKLRRGDNKSCGCLRVDFCLEHFVSHGYARVNKATPEYKTWLGIKSRCTNPKNKSFARYGGRGITLSAEWAASFEQFLADMGPKPTSRHSIERADLNGPYCKENCHWATLIEQANNRSNNVPITWQGETLNMAQWAQLAGMNHQLLWARMSAGWDFETALVTPTKPRCGYKKALRQRQAFLVATEPK